MLGATVKWTNQAAYGIMWWVWIRAIKTWRNVKCLKLKKEKSSFIADMHGESVSIRD